MKCLAAVVFLGLCCTAVRAETVITAPTETSAGIVVQGKVLRSSDNSITIEIPLYGGLVVARSTLKDMYAKNVNIEAAEEQAAVRAVADANRRLETEKEERQKAMAIRDLPEERQSAASGAGSTPKTLKSTSKTEETTKKLFETPDKTKKTPPDADTTKKPAPKPKKQVDPLAPDTTRKPADLPVPVPKAVPARGQPAVPPVPVAAPVPPAPK